MPATGLRTTARDATMASDVIDRSRRWFDDEQDAHDKVLASFDSVPAQRRDTPEFRKAVALFARMVAIEQGETQAAEQLLPLVYDERGLDKRGHRDIILKTHSKHSPWLLNNGTVT
jgi:hypothetical protein